MKAPYIITLLLICLFAPSYSQGNEEQSVADVVERLFESMRRGDSSMVHSTFNEVNHMFTAIVKDGQSVLNEGSLDSFLNAVGTAHDKTWDEPIWDMEINIDGNLAQAWTKYAFYHGGKFSHCGVDAFQLIKTSDGWKIFQLTDTRQTEGCVIPKKIKAKSEF